MQTSDFGNHNHISIQNQGRPAARTTAILHELFIHSLTFSTLEIEYPIENSSQRYQVSILVETMHALTGRFIMSEVRE